MICENRGKDHVPRLSLPKLSNKSDPSALAGGFGAYANPIHRPAIPTPKSACHNWKLSQGFFEITLRRPKARSVVGRHGRVRTCGRCILLVLLILRRSVVVQTLRLLVLKIHLGVDYLADYPADVDFFLRDLSIMDVS